MRSFFSLRSSRGRSDNCGSFWDWCCFTLRQHRIIRGARLACINARQMSQNFLTMRQHGLQKFVTYAEISDCAIRTPELCGVALRRREKIEACGIVEEIRTNHPFTDMKVVDNFEIPTLWAFANGVQDTDRRLRRLRPWEPPTPVSAARWHGSCIALPNTRMPPRRHRTTADETRLRRLSAFKKLHKANASSFRALND